MFFLFFAISFLRGKIPIELTNVKEKSEPKRAKRELPRTVKCSSAECKSAICKSVMVYKKKSRFVFIKKAGSIFNR